MKNFVTVSVVAIAVVLIYVVMDSGFGVSSVNLPASTMLDPRAQSVQTAAPASSKEATGQRSVLPAGGHVVNTAGGFQGRCEERGVVGTAVLEMIRITHGQEIRTIDRSFTFEYHKILMAWKDDPSRIDEDVRFLLEAWDSVKDDAFRWSLSWLFERTGEDRFVDKVVELFRVDAWRAVDGLGGIGSKKAIERLIESIPTIERPEVRSQGRIRVARSGVDGAVDYLVKATKDPTLTDHERIVAAEALGLVATDDEALREAMKIVLGPPVPVGDLGERNGDYPVRDLRAAGAMAVMKRGDQDSVRRLLVVADGAGAEPGFTRLIDHALAGYQGADITRVIFDRVARRRFVSLGEARYFNSVGSSADAAAIESIIHLGTDEVTRDLLRAAALNARTR